MLEIKRPRKKRVATEAMGKSRLYLYLAVRLNFQPTGGGRAGTEIILICSKPSGGIENQHEHRGGKS